MSQPQREQVADDDVIGGLREQMAESGKREAAARAEVEKQVAARVLADESAIAANINSATTALAAAESELAKALEEGRTADAAKAQVNIAKATVALDKWQEKGTALQGWKKQTTDRMIRERSQPTPPANQNQSQYTPQTQAWLDKNGIDGSKPNTRLNKAISAHFAAEAEGIRQDTPEYFDFLDQHMGVAPAAERPSAQSPLSQAANADEVEIDLNPPSDTRIVDRSPPPRVAHPSQGALPPSRSGSSVTGSGQVRAGNIRLNPREQEAARASFPHLKTDEEKLRAYAENKAALIQEGRL